MTFANDIWPWLWPSLIFGGWCVMVAAGYRRWVVRRDPPIEDRLIRWVIRLLVTSLIILGSAFWVSTSPLLERNTDTQWVDIWPWMWPSFVLGMLVGLIVVLTRWFVRGMGNRLQAGEGSTGQGTIKRVAYSVMFGTILGVVLLWVWLVPAPRIVVIVLGDDVLPWVIPTLILIGWTAVGLFLSRRLLDWLAGKSKKTVQDFDDLIVQGLRRPVWLIVMISGLHLWAGLAPFPATLDGYIQVGTKAGFVFMITMLADAFVQGWMVSRAQHSAVLATSGGVLRTAARVIIYIIGFLMVLSSLTIDVTPLLASLGVGSLAIGLALQKTLEDFLAGLFLAADQPVRIGDYVQLSDGEGGTILTIGWRTTRIRTREDTHVIVPNSKLSTSTLINRSMPDSELSFTIPLGVDYDSDLNQVTEVTLEVATLVQSDETTGVSDFKPKVMFEKFGDSSIDLRVWMRATSWITHFALRDAFIKNIHQRYRKENIRIPFPTRTVAMVPPPDVPPQDA